MLKENFDMNNFNWKSIPKFNFNGEQHTYAPQLISMYDADTISVVHEINNKLYKMSLRINLIDAIEKKIFKKDKDQLTEEELNILVQRRTESENYMKNVISKPIIVNYGPSDMYQRPLSDIYQDNLHINQDMIDRKLVFPYGPQFAGGLTKLLIREQLEWVIKNPSKLD